MLLDIPDELIERAKRLAQGNEDPITIFGKALDRMEWETQETAAVVQGIQEYQAGEARPIVEFGKEIRDQLGMKLPEA